MSGTGPSCPETNPREDCRPGGFPAADGGRCSVRLQMVTITRRWANQLLANSQLHGIRIWEFAGLISAGIPIIGAAKSFDQMTHPLGISLLMVYPVLSVKKLLSLARFMNAASMVESGGIHLRKSTEIFMFREPPPNFAISGGKIFCGEYDDVVGK